VSWNHRAVLRSVITELGARLDVQDGHSLRLARLVKGQPVRWANCQQVIDRHRDDMKPYDETRTAIGSLLWFETGPAGPGNVALYLGHGLAMWQGLGGKAERRRVTELPGTLVGTTGEIP